MIQEQNKKGYNAMGMAGSQARLLCLTARIHDVEQSAQTIQQAKIALSTSENEAYEKYNNALEESLLTVVINSGTTQSTIAANFNNLCSKNKADFALNQDISLMNKYDELIVPDEIYNLYKSIGTNIDAQTFAMCALTGKSPDEIKKCLIDAENTAKENSTNKKVTESYDAVYEYLQGIATKNSSDAEDIDIYDISELGATDVQNETYKKLLNTYRKALYNDSGDAIYEKISGKDNYDRDDFNYYANYFNKIKANGDKCIPISDYNSTIFEGNAENNSEWLTNCVQSGEIRIVNANTDANGETILKTTSPSSDSLVSYTNATKVDSTKAKKAEAEYEHELSLINKQDKKYDLELSKLEAEREALTKEYDSVKTVIKDNIERTFGIFS